MKAKHHCHCGLESKVRQLRAKKLGALGGVLIVLHLLYHVAECLVLPAILLAMSHPSSEMSSELSAKDIYETTLISCSREHQFLINLPSAPFAPADILLAVDSHLLLPHVSHASPILCSLDNM